MSIFRLVLRNLRHYFRSWVLTVAAIALGMAVLTGALITGDSVTYSLAEIVHMRLGRTEFALESSGRYFRYQLSEELSQAFGAPVISALRARGSATDPSSGDQANRVEILGIDSLYSRLWEGAGHTFRVPGKEEAVVGSNLAGRLHLSVNDILLVRLPREGFAPVNAPFVSGISTGSVMRLKVIAIADDRTGGRFSLEKNQSSPFNVFVSRSFLAGQMGIPGFANTLLVVPGGKLLSAGTLDSLLRKTWKPEDAGLKTSPVATGMMQLTSDRIFIEDTLARLIRHGIDNSMGVYTYLVNEIRCKDKMTPYSFVSAADSGIFAETPGPGEIVLNSWLAEDLKARKGDTVYLKFWIPVSGGSLKETKERFTVRSVVAMKNSPAYRLLMPEFPGLKNTDKCRDWETGTVVDLHKIRDKDEVYWNTYRGTPKAWISLADGQRIWKNPFGRYTAFRYRDTSGINSLTARLHQMDPSVLGLSFRPVLTEGTAAASASTDFAGLFLSLGALILVSGLLLSVMLLAFFLEGRAREVSIYRALGFGTRKIFRILTAETFFLSITGSFVGLLLAILYARLMVSGLNTLWSGAVNTTGLLLCIQGKTLFTGLTINVLMSFAALCLVVLKKNNRLTPSPYQLPSPVKNSKKNLLKIIGYLVSGLFVVSSFSLILTEILSGRFYPSVAFMTAGILLLTGILISVTIRLKDLPNARGNLTHKNIFTRHLRLNVSTSVTVISLISVGTFTLMLTGLNRQSAGNQAGDPHSGTGGFSLWMETDLPVYQDLNSREGRKKTAIDEDKLPAGLRFIPIPQVGREDASCLNLNQVSQPVLAGIPAGTFGKRGLFSFAGLAPDVNPDHPWESLLQGHGGRCINGFADQTVITWGLHLKIGDTLHYRDERGMTLDVRIAGGLQNSVFQGKVLISDSLMNQYFPLTLRTREFLISADEGNREKTIKVLEAGLRDQGAVVIPAGEKLASFEAVENTYLNVFTVLGGFGLLLGTAGFAVVVMRNLRERRRETGLYLSLGFLPCEVARGYAREFRVLLFTGLVAGVISGFTGALPSLFSGSGTNPVPAFLIILVVLLNGLFWIRILTRYFTLPLCFIQG